MTPTPDTATDYDRAVLVRVVVYHQRTEDLCCACGWGRRREHLGLSFADHIADTYEDTIRIEAP